MAAHRPAYSNFATCMRSADAAPQAQGRWVFPPWLINSKEENQLMIPNDACVTQLADACRLCVCCKYCPCVASPSFVMFVSVSVAAGVLLLALVSNAASVADWFRIKTKARTTAPLTASTPSQSEPNEDDTTTAPLMTTLNMLNNNERCIVRKAIDVWHAKGMIPDAQRLALLQSVEDDPSVRSSSTSSHAVPALIVLAFIVALYESTTSGTVLHAFFSSFAWGSVPALGKALAMLTLAALTEILIPGNNLHWEVSRVFFLMAFIGSVVISVLDTGRHEGETSGGENGAGSNMWYATVGCLGTIGVLFLSYAAPRHFQKANWWACVSMTFLANSGGTYRACVWMASLSVLLIVTSLVLSRTSVVASKQLTADIHEIGIFFLVMSAAIAELNEPELLLSSGKVLGVTGTLVVAYGAACERSSLQAAVGTAAICVASVVAWWDHPCFIGGLNLTLRLVVVFILGTMAVGGWGLSPLIRLPSKTHMGVTRVLVGVTLILLLSMTVTGNSRHGKEWINMMDFDSGNAFVDGGYAYQNRGIYILPWCAPLVLYYRMLYQYWPEQERHFRRFHVLRLGVLFAVACHLLRLLSWSMLFLTLAGVVATLPWIENYLQGGP